jgi:hypothetical protein
MPVLDTNFSILFLLGDFVAVVFEIELNGQPFALAGHEALCVLHVNVSASGKLGKDSKGIRHRGEDYDIALHAGGLTAIGERQRDQHLRWGTRKPLVEGDEIRIRIRNTEEFDKPTESSPVKRQGGSNDAISERRAFRKAREIYNRLIFKYGSKRERAAFVTRRLVFLRGASRWE